MNIKQDISAYINSIGVEQASVTFGRSPQAIKALLKTKAFAADIVQVYIDILEAGGGTLVEQGVVATQEEVGPEPGSAFNDSVTAEINSLRARMQHVEEYLLALNQSQQPNPLNVANGFNRVSVPWAPPEPHDSNVQSFVRPGNGVPGSTLSMTAPVVQHAPPKVVTGRPGMTPADSWLTPIPKKS